MMMNTLSKFKGNQTGDNVGDSEIYASDCEALLFEAEQIPFDLHHKIQQAIRKAERNAASLAKQKIIRMIETSQIYAGGSEGCTITV